MPMPPLMLLLMGSPALRHPAEPVLAPPTTAIERSCASARTEAWATSYAACVAVQRGGAIRGGTDASGNPKDGGARAAVRWLLASPRAQCPGADGRAGGAPGLGELASALRRGDREAAARAVDRLPSCADPGLRADGRALASLLGTPMPDDVRRADPACGSGACFVRVIDRPTPGPHPVGALRADAPEIRDAVSVRRAALPEAYRDLDVLTFSALVFFEGRLLAIGEDTDAFYASWTRVRLEWMLRVGSLAMNAVGVVERSPGWVARCRKPRDWEPLLYEDCIHLLGRRSWARARGCDRPDLPLWPGWDGREGCP